mgnify:CR=1 FL=1
MVKVEEVFDYFDFDVSGGLLLVVGYPPQGCFCGFQLIYRLLVCLHLTANRPSCVCYSLVF